MDRQRFLSRGPSQPARNTIDDAGRVTEQASTGSMTSPWRDALRRLAAPLVVIGGIALKFGAVIIAFGGYALIWGWEFALGVVLLIFVHEMGHFAEATRERLRPSWPIFIPFLGAYVKYTRGNPWQTARVALAGPALGGLAALGCYLLGKAYGSNLLLALGYFGFVLNLINLFPAGILDGGAVWRSTRWLWHGGGREKALTVGVLYAGTALVLAIGAVAAYVPQHRL